jgi:hypothetical protein
VTQSLYFNYAQKAKGSKMETKTKTDLSDLATEAMVASIPATTVQPQAETPCTEKDTACNKRWIDSLSDCC